MILPTNISDVVLSSSVSRPGSTLFYIGIVSVCFVIAVSILAFLIIRQNSQRVLSINGKNNENVEKLTNEGVDEVDCKNNGHENIAISVSDSSEAIRIENEINNAIKEINEIGNNEESSKLIDKPQTKEDKQTVVDLVSNTEEAKIDGNKKSSSKLNVDIEKQPLNQE